MSGMQKLQLCKMKGHVIGGLTDQDENKQLAS